MREKLDRDPFMWGCIVSCPECSPRIEWHHALTYAGKRINEPWAILPLCSRHHQEQAKYRTEQLKAMKERITFFGADLSKYPKLIL